ncbi:hypothetical protein [Nocardia sp. NPDC050435]|uniref:hypothetical protein n=1 Tax=Nocardia sp. NPDC050435 TaxID=3155040 RepID=UPI0033E80CDA
MLHEIHALAAESARLRREIPVTERQVTDWVHLHERLDKIHRQRELTEITAREHGLAPQWIELARMRGIEGRDLTGDQLLPPTSRAPGWRTPHRLASDAERLAYMAAVHTVRNHLRANAGLTVEADPAAVQRFTRNLDALRNRAAAIAASPAVSASKVLHAFAGVNALLEGEIGQYLTYSLADLEALWWPLTSRAMGSDLRKSIKNLRAAAGDTDRNHTLIPASENLLEQAHQALAAAITTGPEAGSGAAIEAAISAGLSESAALAWEPATDTGETAAATVESQRAIGPETLTAEPP